MHAVVEGREEFVPGGLAFFGGESKRADPLDEEFSGVGLGAEDLHDFGDEVGEGHGAGVGGLALALELGLHVGRDELEDFDFGFAELIAERLGPGMDGGFGGAIGGSGGHRHEGEAGGDGDDGGARLPFKVRQQRGGEAEGREEVGGDDVPDDGEIGGGLIEIFGLHDAGVMDEDVEGGELAGYLGGEGGEGVEILHVEDGGLHAGIGGRDFIEEGFAASGDDELIAFFVEGFGEGAADAGAAAGDEDGVASDLHGESPAALRIDGGRNRVAMQIHAGVDYRGDASR